jgi:hypothetical protein
LITKKIVDNARGAGDILFAANGRKFPIPTEVFASYGRIVAGLIKVFLGNPGVAAGSGVGLTSTLVFLESVAGEGRI